MAVVIGVRHDPALSNKVLKMARFILDLTVCKDAGKRNCKPVIAKLGSGVTYTG